MLEDKINTTKALGLLDGYFNDVALTGYVRHSNVKRFLLYLFLLDFVDVSCPFLTSEDYSLIDELLRKIMNGNSCLLPYDLFCKYRTSAGYPGCPDDRIFTAYDGIPLNVE